MTFFYKEMKSPVGKLKLVASSKALVAVLWEQERPNRVKIDKMNLDPQHPILIEAERQISEYFAGKRTQFDLLLQPDGTEFQKKVWRALRGIPFGKTKSYLDLARAIGSPNAYRAVGAANGKNPLSIIVPCHRVVGADGALTGFAGGLETKAALLALEAKTGKEPRPHAQFVRPVTKAKAVNILKEVDYGNCSRSHHRAGERQSRFSRVLRRNLRLEGQAGPRPLRASASQREPDL